MNTNLQKQARPQTKSYVFGSFYRRRDPVRGNYPVVVDFRRLGLVAAVALVFVYGLAVIAGYVWLHKIRGMEQISVEDVVFMRWREVRRGMAAQQFIAAKQAWDAKEYQKAFLTYGSAVRTDPDNIDGRIGAADFLLAAGAPDLAISALEEGLIRTPDNRKLLVQTFDLLSKMGRFERALKLLRGTLASRMNGDNSALLRRFEVTATLALTGPDAAAQLLERYPELKNSREAAPVVAQVLWESKQRLTAIDTLTAYFKNKPDTYISFAQLVSYQEAAGMNVEARATAEQASLAFPQEPGPRLLLIETLAPSYSGEVARWQQAIEAYLKDFHDKAEAVTQLSDLAGRRGWVDLARTLYETGANRQIDVRLLALYYSDALMHSQRTLEARDVLAEVEAQTQDEGSPFARLLWQRQIVAAAAAGDHDEARETARKLAVALRRYPEELESCQRRFKQLGIAEAVSELASPSVGARRAEPKKS